MKINKSSSSITSHDETEFIGGDGT